MLLEVQTFQYIVQNEDGDIMGEYLSSGEPPASGDVIPLQGSPDGALVEVLGVTMLLAKHYNQIVLKVKRV